MYMQLIYNNDTKITNHKVMLKLIVKNEHAVYAKTRHPPEQQTLS